MGHLQIIESELRRLLVDAEAEAVISWVKERVLESYRNGQAAGPAPRRGASSASASATRSPAPANLPV